MARRQIEGKEALKAAVERLRGEGWGFKAIGKELGIGRVTAWMWAKEMGLDTSAILPRVKVDLEELRRDFVEEGLRLLEIEEKRGISHDTARRWLKRMGVDTTEWERVSRFRGKKAEEEIMREWKTQQEIRGEYGVSVGALRRVRRKYNGEYGRKNKRRGS